MKNTECYFRMELPRPDHTVALLGQFWLKVPIRSLQNRGSESVHERYFSLIDHIFTGHVISSQDNDAFKNKGQKKTTDLLQGTNCVTSRMFQMSSVTNAILKLVDHFSPGVECESMFLEMNRAWIPTVSPRSVFLFRGHRNYMCFVCGTATTRRSEMKWIDHIKAHHEPEFQRILQDRRKSRWLPYDETRSISSPRYCSRKDMPVRIEHRSRAF